MKMRAFLIFWLCFLIDDLATSYSVLGQPLKLLLPEERALLRSRAQTNSYEGFHPDRRLRVGL